METIKVNINKITPHAGNPRIIKDDKFKKLVKSIQEFPEMMEARPIVCNREGIIIGGNMRHRAAKEAGLKEVFVTYVDFTPEQEREFMIKDNVSGGEWDWEILANEWDASDLTDWGLDVPNFEPLTDEYGEEFSLPEGDKAPFQQMTFTLADEQATQIKNAIDDIKKTNEFKYAETMGNENSNGNALYLIIMQWAGQRI